MCSYFVANYGTNNYHVHYCVILQKPMEFNVYSPDHGSLICPLEPNLGRISGGVQAVGYNWK